MWNDLKPPAIFAHRGASAQAPENTIAAFEMALRHGADGIELDTKLSRDGQVVVLHDQTVDRTTDGNGYVGKLTLAELKKLDAGSHFDIAFQGEAIPTLDEVFQVFGSRTFINVELANYLSPHDALPQKVAALVRRHDLAARLLFSSFHPLILLRIRRYLPEVPIGLLAFSGKKGALTRSWLGALLQYDSLHVEQADARTGLIERLHKAGKRVFAYTCNSPETMLQLFKNKVDGMITDDPLLARNILQWSASRR